MEYSGDVVDVTAASYHPKSFFDRVYIPRGGPLQVSFAVQDRSKGPTNVAALGIALVDEYNKSGYPGTYATRVRNGVLEILPAQTLGSDGQTRQVVPLMDTLVALEPKKERSNSEVMDALLNSIKQQTGRKVVLGNLLRDNFLRAQFSSPALSLPARDIIEQASLSTGRHASWLLLYDPTFKEYVLSML